MADQKKHEPANPPPGSVQEAVERLQRELGKQREDAWRNGKDTSGLGLP